MPSVRIFVKGQRQIGKLGFKQYQMLKLGTVGLAAVKNRVQSGLNAQDAPAKKLSKPYAIRKTKIFKKRAIRDLTLSGQMLRNLQVRTVSNNTAQARNTTRRDRQKSNRQNEIEPWLLFSRKNQAAVQRAAQLIFAETIRHLVK